MWRWAMGSIDERVGEMCCKGPMKGTRAEKARQRDEEHLERHGEAGSDGDDDDRHDNLLLVSVGHAKG